MNHGMPPNQPPQGQPQQSIPQQQPQGQYQGAPQQPYPAQQYGQQPYYGPPQKSGTGKLVIIILAVVLGGPMLLGILAVAAIPLISNNTRDARRAEAESIAGSTSTQLRALRAKTGMIPRRIDGQVVRILDSGVGQFVSSTNYQGSPTSGSGGYSENGTGTITITMKNPSDGQYVVVFDFQTGAKVSEVWHD